MEERDCKNCVYYRAHYIKKLISYMPINCGHCVKNLRKKYFVPCSAWTENTVKPEQRQEAIKTVLRNMCRWIAEIAQILKEDIKTENISDDGGENADN